MSEKYVVLAGGVGAAKFIEGLINVVSSEDLIIIVNTCDDIELFGLKICPDLDIITYTIAGLVDKNKGWGFESETFNCLDQLSRFYDFKWFNAGDKDLATHIYRTHLFKQGFNKAQITQKICTKLGITCKIIPMCNELVETYIQTPNGTIHFEEYFIKERCEPEILGIEFKGIENARPVENILEDIKNARKILISPSNPIVSIGTILQVKDIRKSLINVKEKVYAISPIIEGTTVKGPADKLMNFLDIEVSCLGVAKFYQDLLGHFIIDKRDCRYKEDIKKLGIQAYCFDTLMMNIEKKISLADFIIKL
ncbi:MAG: 2-phospho-L-lactate transferase [Promethearchaeota archaeon]